MKVKIVICPTLRNAFYEWNRLAEAHFDMWTAICRKPMSLTSADTKYIFCSEYATIEELKGLHEDFISVDEVKPQGNEDEITHETMEIIFDEIKAEICNCKIEHEFQLPMYDTKDRLLVSHIYNGIINAIDNLMEQKGLERTGIKNE